MFCVYVLIHYLNSPGWNASLQGTFSREKILCLPLFLCYMIASKEMLLQVKVVWNIAGSSLAHIKMYDALPIKKKKFTNDPVARLSSSCSVVQECLFMSVVNTSMLLTLTLLTWKICWDPNNASRWQMGFNLAFKRVRVETVSSTWQYEWALRTVAQTTDVFSVWNVTLDSCFLWQLHVYVNRHFFVYYICIFHVDIAN